MPEPPARLYLSGGRAVTDDVLTRLRGEGYYYAGRQRVVRQDEFVPRAPEPDPYAGACRRAGVGRTRGMRHEGTRAQAAAADALCRLWHCHFLQALTCLYWLHQLACGSRHRVGFGLLEAIAGFCRSHAAGAMRQGPEERICAILTHVTTHRIASHRTATHHILWDASLGASARGQ